MLAPRQSEIVSLVLNGYSNAEIADELKIALQTVKNQLYRAYKKLGVKDRKELLKYYVEEQNYETISLNP